MITVYIPLTKFTDGKWYQTFEIPENMPLSPDWVIAPPPEEYKYPKFDYIDMQWHEDKDRVITELTTENAELRQRLEMTEGAVIELARMVIK